MDWLSPAVNSLNLFTFATIPNHSRSNFYIIYNILYPFKKVNYTMNIFFIFVNFMYYELISTPGCSLSVGRAVSLLVAIAPAGSHLSRFSHRSLAPSVPINFLIYYSILNNDYEQLVEIYTLIIHKREDNDLITPNESSLPIYIFKITKLRHSNVVY